MNKFLTKSGVESSSTNDAASRNLVLLALGIGIGAGAYQFARRYKKKPKSIEQEEPKTPTTHGSTEQHIDELESGEI